MNEYIRICVYCGQNFKTKDATLLGCGCQNAQASATQFGISQPDIKAAITPSLWDTPIICCIECHKEGKIVKGEFRIEGGFFLCAHHWNKLMNKIHPSKPSAEKQKSLLQDFDQSLIQKVNIDRQSVYGHPLENFNRIQTLKAVVKDCSDAAIREVLEAVCVKLARLVQTPDHFDSILDIAGYARCAIMILEKRKSGV
jgi:hypothetical protein